MSANSSESKPHGSSYSPVGRARHAARLLLAATAVSLWTLAAVFGLSGFLVMTIVGIGMRQIGWQFDESSALLQMSLSIVVYILGLSLLLIEPFAIRRLGWRDVRRLLGVDRLIKWIDIPQTLAGWAGYMLLTTLVLNLVAAYVPWIDLTQTQDIGFGSLTGSWDVLWVFLTVCVLAPVVEEMVFRGYLFGSLRRWLPFWVTSIVVSGLFGMVHGQWNVALDTFVLSMVASYLRERTGAIWSGVMLHFLKNFISFSVLFLLPEWLQKLIGV